VTPPGTFYLTTPIYYVNARPHLGHAYTTIAADAMCRYRRLTGAAVHFLTGTDEHGDKIGQAAAQAGVSPQAYADEISAVFRATWRRLGISNDDFIRTTEARHQQVVRAILQTLHDRGELYFGKYGGLYCFGCERFYTDKEAVDGGCPQHRTPLQFIEEENYFFKMSKYQDWLVRYIEEHPALIRPERYRNEVLGFLREPLQDLSISRPKTRLTWGIPLPFDDRFVTYVWFDALINYVSALGGPGADAYQAFWPHARHLIGKDILKPHGVYWPCMLRAAGLPVYAGLVVHGYWNLGGGKMSKSIGNVVEALELADKYGHDAFRYYLLREMTFGLDANFSEEALLARLNADLANDLGNFVSRATTMIVNFGAPAAAVSGAADDDAVRRSLTATQAGIAQAMDEFAFQRALTEIWEFVRVLNGYVDQTKPWELAKDPTKRSRLDAVLLTLADALGCLGVLLDPFVPDAAGKIRVAVGRRGPARLADAVFGRLPTLPQVQKLSGLFPRTDTRPASPEELAVAGAGPAPAPPRIAISDFARIELRVAQVLAAEPVAKSKKLLKLSVDLGEAAPRTVVAGIAEHYAPADLVGKKVIVVANLEPARLMGVESNGMLLAGSTDGALAILSLDRDLPPGCRVK
jgi:methionyl-tRNA synthetase